MTNRIALGCVALLAAFALVVCGCTPVPEKNEQPSEENASVDKIDYAKSMELYKDRFNDPNNFIFYFVGNIDEDAFKPLVEQYLASLKKNVIRLLPRPVSRHQVC